MIEIQEVPKRFCRCTIYMLLSLRPATIDELKSVFRSEFHAQLEQILLDGLHDGIFSLMYGGCKDGLWGLNKTCSDRRARHFIGSPAPILFPEKIRHRSLYGNVVENNPGSQNLTISKKQKTKKSKLHTQSKTSNIKYAKKYTSNRTKINNQRRDWNDKIAFDFEKEMQRLRKMRFNTGLDGVDRGALK